MSNVHDGHRQRMKERFLQEGFENFKDHELLEFLLFFTVPRINTNELAHELIDRFGGFSEVFDAEVSELTDVKHITENSAIMLKSVMQLAREYSIRSVYKKAMDNYDAVFEYFRYQFMTETDEVVKLSCLDDRMVVTACEIVSKGAPSTVPLNVRKIVELTYKNKADKIMLAHNHPNGVAEASQNDITATRYLYRVLKTVGITMLDHIIVGRNSECSMKNCGILSLID